MARPLPWVTHPSNAWRWLVDAAGVVAAGLVVLVLPWWSLRWAGRRNPRGMRVLLSLPVVVAIIYGPFRALRAYISDPAASDAMLFLLYVISAIASVPTLLYLAALGRAILTRRPRSLVALAMITAATTSAYVAYQFRIDRPKMSAGEYYDWSLAFLGLLPGTYLAGTVLLGWMIVRWFGRRIGRLLGKRNLHLPGASA
jgi:hypothetical protein